MHLAQVRNDAGKLPEACAPKAKDFKEWLAVRPKVSLSRRLRHACWILLYCRADMLRRSSCIRNGQPCLEQCDRCLCMTVALCASGISRHQHTAFL